MASCSICHSSWERSSKNCSEPNAPSLRLTWVSWPSGGEQPSSRLRGARGVPRVRGPTTEMISVGGLQRHSWHTVAENNGT